MSDATKKIKILDTFLDDGQKFIKDETRFVTPEKCGYYCGNGWAKDLTGEVETADPDLSEVTLEVQDGDHSSEAESPSGS